MHGWMDGQCIWDGEEKSLLFRWGPVNHIIIVDQPFDTFTVHFHLMSSSTFQRKYLPPRAHWIVIFIFISGKIPVSTNTDIYVTVDWISNCIAYWPIVPESRHNAPKAADARTLIPLRSLSQWETALASDEKTSITVKRIVSARFIRVAISIIRYPSVCSVGVTVFWTEQMSMLFCAVVKPDAYSFSPVAKRFSAPWPMSIITCLVC